MNDWVWHDRTTSATMFQLALDELKMSKAGAARFLGVTSRQVARYLDGTRDIPIPTMMLLRLMLKTRHRPAIPPTPTGQRRR